MAGSNITCRLFAAFERFKNPNLIRLAKYLPAYKGKIGLAVCCMLTAGLSSSLIATLLGRLHRCWLLSAAGLGGACGSDRADPHFASPRREHVRQQLSARAGLSVHFG